MGMNKEMALKTIESLKRSDLNCNVFSVYDYCGLSMQELLCEFFTKINQCTDAVNKTVVLVDWLVNQGLSEEVANKLDKWMEDGTLANIINNTIFEDLNRKINTVLPIVSKLNAMQCNVKDFGAIGNGVNDDTLAFQRAIDNCDIIYVPPGNYLIDSVILKPNKKIYGSKDKSFIITKDNPQNIGFTWSGTTDFIEITDLSFKGNGMAICNDNYNDYLSTCLIKNCHFYKNLSMCIRGNLILSEIENCTFGYMGTYNPHNLHKHIHIQGVHNGNATNINFFRRNRFYGATGKSFFAENGYSVYFEGNNFELNNSKTPLIEIKGMYLIDFRGNWFEQNTCDYQLFFTNNSAQDQGNYIITIENNFIYSTNQQESKGFMKVEGSAGINVRYNGGNLYGKCFLSYYDKEDKDFRTWYENRLVNMKNDVKNTINLEKVKIPVKGYNKDVWFENWNTDSTQGWNKSDRLQWQQGEGGIGFGKGIKYTTSDSENNNIYITLPQYYFRGKKIRLIGIANGTGGTDKMRLGYNFTENKPVKLNGISEWFDSSNYKELKLDIDVPTDASYVHVGFTSGGTSTTGTIVAFDVILLDDRSDMIEPYLSR